jgi:hypothetical protein
VCWLQCVWLGERDKGRDGSLFKDVFFAGDSIGINRESYSGYGGLEKSIEKSETLKSF